MKENSGVREDKLLFIVVGIILLVALIIIGVWFFTKNEDKNNDKNETPTKEEEKKDDDTKDEDKNDVVIIVPKEVETKDNSNETPVPEEVEDIVWYLPNDLLKLSVIGKKISVNKMVLIDGIEHEAFVMIQRETSADVWENIAFTNSEFIPNLSGNYRFIYTYNNEMKYFNFIIQNEIVSSVSKTLINDDGTGNLLMNQRDFRNLMYNQGLIDLSIISNLHIITVDGLLKTDETTDTYKNFGLIVDISGLYPSITSITSNTLGVEAVLTNSTSYGADTENGLVLLMVDSTYFSHNTPSVIELDIDGDTYSFEIMINNWQIPGYVQTTVIEQKEVEVIPEIFVNEAITSLNVTVKVEEFINGNWIEIILVNDKYTPELNHKYRYTYIYEMSEKILEINVVEELDLDDLSKVDITDSYVSNPNITEDDYNVIKDNQSKITVTSDLGVYKIAISGILDYLNDDSSLRIPVGLIADLNSKFSEISNVTTITNGVYIDEVNKDLFGADNLYEILIWLDKNEFELNKEYNITLKITGKDSLTNELEIEESFIIYFE